MSGFMRIVLSFAVIAILQTVLSIKANKYLGLLIPSANVLGSVWVARQFSDMVSAILGLIVSVVPLAIWLGIYDACQRKLAKQKQDEIRRMQINDL